MRLTSTFDPPSQHDDDAKRPSAYQEIMSGFEDCLKAALERQGLVCEEIEAEHQESTGTIDLIIEDNRGQRRVFRIWTGQSREQAGTITLNVFERKLSPPMPCNPGFIYQEKYPMSGGKIPDASERISSAISQHLETPVLCLVGAAPAA